MKPKEEIFKTFIVSFTREVKTSIPKIPSGISIPEFNRLVSLNGDLRQKIVDFVIANGFRDVLPCFSEVPSLCQAFAKFAVESKDSETIRFLAYTPELRNAIAKFAVESRDPELLLPVSTIYSLCNDIANLAVESRDPSAIQLVSHAPALLESTFRLALERGDRHTLELMRAIPAMSEACHASALRTISSLASQWRLDEVLFWKSCPFITPEEFQQACRPLVPKFLNMLERDVEKFHRIQQDFPNLMESYELKFEDAYKMFEFAALNSNIDALKIALNSPSFINGYDAYFRNNEDKQKTIVIFASQLLASCEDPQILARFRSIRSVNVCFSEYERSIERLKKLPRASVTSPRNVRLLPPAPAVAHSKAQSTPSGVQPKTPVLQQRVHNVYPTSLWSMSEPMPVLPLLPTPHAILPTPAAILPTPAAILPTPYGLLPTPPPGNPSHAQHRFAQKNPNTSACRGFSHGRHSHLYP